MEQITNILFWISNGLMIPALILLIYFFIKSIIMLGKVLGQYIQRQKQEQQVRLWVEKITMDNLGECGKELDDMPSNVFIRTAKEVINGGNIAVIDKSINQFEIERGKETDNAKLLIKFGPILGLMGTLIPMGPALAGLSIGDIASMAYNMQIAFATTVLGLFIGAIGFALFQIKQRWIQIDVARLDFLAELRMGE